MADRKKQKVIIDTDVGIDDALAINFCAASREFDVLAITLVAGNASMDVISENCRRILTYLQIEYIPVHEGGSYNLMGEYIQNDGYFGDNALANIELPLTTITQKENMHSAEALVHYVNMYPGEVNLLCLGPLTNLALAFFLDNTFPSLVGSITVMGSSINDKIPSRGSNFTEFNAWCDPLSYHIVNECFNAIPTPIVIVDWEYTNKYLLPITMRESMLQDGYKGKKAIEFFLKFSDTGNALLAKNYKENGLVCSDLVAAVLLKNPEYIELQNRYILRTIMEGEKRGETQFLVVPTGIFQLVKKFNVEKTAQAIIKTLASD